MGSSPSKQAQDDSYDFDFNGRYGPRDLPSAKSRVSIKKPGDTKSTILRVEKKKLEKLTHEEKEREENSYAPFVPRNMNSGFNPGSKGGLALKKGGGAGGTAAPMPTKSPRKSRKQNSQVSFGKNKDYSPAEDDTATLDGRGSKGEKEPDSDDDGLKGKDKIESYLRKGRVPETKVRSLAIKIYEHARRETQQQLQGLQKDKKGILEILTTTINQPLDLLLFGKAQKTNIKKIESDVDALIQKVSDMVELLETDMALCFDSAEKHIHNGKGGGSKSIPLVIREALLALDTDHDILQEKYNSLVQHMEELHQEQAMAKHRTEALEQSSLQVEREFKRISEQNKVMSDQIMELKGSRKQLKDAESRLEEDNAQLKKQVQWYQDSNAMIHKELLKLQETCTQLQVQCGDQAKEIRRLRDPDKNMIFKIQRLETDLTDAKTSNRKLEIERGHLRGALQKLQAQYDSLQKDRTSLAKSKAQLVKENEAVKTTNKKLKFSSSQRLSTTLQ